MKLNLKQKCINIWGETFVNNCGMYLVFCGFYNSTWYIFLYNVALIVAYTGMIGHTFYYAIFVERDIAIAAEAAHFTVIVSIVILFFVAFLLCKRRLDQAFKALSEVGFKYNDTMDPETSELIDSFYKQTERRKEIIHRVLAAAFLSTGITSVFLLPISSGRFSVVEKDDPINRRSPIIKSTPYDSKYSSIGWNMTIFTDILGMICVVSVVNAIDIPFVCFAEEGCNQLEILTLGIKRLFLRARYVHLKRFGYPEMSTRDKTFCLCIRECMNDSIKHHIATIGYFRHVTKAYSWPVLIVILSGAFLLCISGIIFVSKNFAFGMKMAFMFYLGAELAHTFIFAYYGEYMSQMSVGLRDVLYSIQWEDSSKTLQLYLVMMQAYCNKSKITLSAVGFMVYNFDNFGNVLRTAYSYFNLMSASGI